jgi:hypothetical protein
VCVLLGAYNPVMLRPTVDGKYRVIGDCYIQGIGDGEALLGPIPSPWRMICVDRVLEYFHTETGEQTVEDPRLEPIPEPWVRIPFKRERHDPRFCENFKNTITGEVLNSDPRLLPDALRARGVKLQTFQLV